MNDFLTFCLAVIVLASIYFGYALRWLLEIWRDWKETEEIRNAS